MLGALPSRPRAAPARKQNRFAGSIQCAQYGRTEESLADPATPPDWFTRAMADAPQERMVEVDGAGVESLSWGERGRPGVLLLHGYAGHAGWWRFIAPFLAQDRRVVAMSWSGMGGSDRRGAYSFDGYAREALAVARAEGLYEAGPPVIVGHSFGSVAMLLAAARYPEALSAAVAVESTLLPLIRVRERAQAAPGERVFATVDAARARFKLSPPTAAAEPYILDVVMNGALGRAPPEEGEGLTWRLDPRLGQKMTAENVSAETHAITCPLTLLWGGDSETSTPEGRAWLYKRLPPHMRHATIPGAGHHVMLDQPLALVAALRTILALPRRAAPCITRLSR
jgi:pimeloyl-ACP methyl ester carboxylesterase